MTQGYEARDVSARAITAAFAGLAALVLFGYLGAAWTFRVISRRLSPASRAPAAEHLPPPPEPRLQADPPADLRELRAEEDAVLNGYGWVDRRRGVVRIPIEEAMALLVKRGVPARKTPPPGESP